MDDSWKKRVPNLNNREVSAQDIAEMIFKSIKIKVEAIENRAIDGVVITVPYSYGKTYSQRIKQSAENAGLKVIQLVEEPVAAAISYGLFGDDIQNNQKEKIAVFDLGGGTFDITIFNFEKSDNQHAKIEVLNTDGVERLGGKNIDEILANNFKNILKVEDYDFLKEKERQIFQSELFDIARKTKETLSVEEDDEIYKLININSKDHLFEKIFKVEELNTLLKNNNFIGKIEDALWRAVNDIDLKPSDIDRIVLAGGTSTIPIVKKVVEDFFGKKTEAKKSLGELVGHGAGILAGLSEDSSLQYTIVRKTSKNIGIAQGNRFKHILNKNFRYGEQSVKKPIKLKNRKSELTITFYEGDSAEIENCEKIGHILIDGTLFKDENIYISLVKEDKSDSQIRCYIYDKEKSLVIDDYLTDD